jgi:hypothetical protein
LWGVLYYYETLVAFSKKTRKYPAQQEQYFIHFLQKSPTYAAGLKDEPKPSKVPVMVFWLVFTYPALRQFQLM